VEGKSRRLRNMEEKMEKESGKKTREDRIRHDKRVMSERMRINRRCGGSEWCGGSLVDCTRLLS
jgi:hypothetical protein